MDRYLFALCEKLPGLFSDSYEDAFLSLGIPIALVTFPHHELLVLVVIIPITGLVHVIMLVGVIFAIMCL